MAGRTTVNITGYAVDDDTTSSDDMFDIAAGATLVLLNDNTLFDDAIEGSGRVSVRGLTTIAEGLTLTGSTLFVDMSDVAQNASAVLLGLAADGVVTGGVSHPDSVTVRNIVGATWSMSDDAAVYIQAGSEFLNLGVLEQTAGTSYFTGKLLDRGTLQIDGSLLINSATARFVADKITGPGLFDLNQGALDGSDVSTAATDLTGVRIVGDVTISSSNVYTSDLSLGARSILDLTGPGAIVNFYDSGIVGAGEIDIRGDDTVGVYAYLTGDVTFDNFSNTTFSTAGPSAPEGVFFTSTAWAGDQVTIENHAGATWTDQGTVSDFFGGGWGSDVFLNNGTFVEDTTNGAAFTMGVINDDIIESGANSQHGQITFDGELTGSGTVEIGLDNVFTDGAVGGGQTLNFKSVTTGAPSPTLIIANPQEFLGTVTGFDQGTSKDLLVVQAPGWQFLGYVADTSGGALDFANTSTGAEAAINLSGAYDSSGFHAVVSGSITTIIYSPTSL